MAVIAVGYLCKCFKLLWVSNPKKFYIALGQKGYVWQPLKTMNEKTILKA